jgi:transketolase
VRDAFIRQLAGLAKDDARIVLLTGDLGFGVFDEYRRILPEQFINVGVAEQNLAAVATGMALEGHIAFTYSIANFPTLRCLEQLRNDACYHGANVKTVAIGGGFSYGNLGYSHHATEDLAILRSLPGMTVVAPADLWEVEQATIALTVASGSAYLRLDKSNAGRTDRPGERFELGKARCLREGDAMTLVGCGGIVAELLAASTALSREGIDCRVISHHTISRVDHEAIASAAAGTGGIVTVEEHTVTGGLGGAIAEWCLENGVLPRRFRRIGLRDEFATVVGSQDYLRERYAMGADAIAKTVRAMLGAER